MAKQGNQSSYTSADLEAVLKKLRITTDNLNNDDVFFIFGQGNQGSYLDYDVYRLPSWSIERQEIWADWKVGDDSPTDGEKNAYYSIPFYNRLSTDITNEGGVALFKGTIALVPNTSPMGDQELSVYRRIMWQPNLSGKCIAFFAEINVTTTTPSTAIFTGYWINLYNIRDLTNRSEGLPPPNGYPRDDSGDFKNPPAPTNPTHAYVITSHPSRLQEVDEDPSAYTIYMMDQDYWTGMDTLMLGEKDQSKNNLIDYMVKGTNQTQIAALDDFTAHAIGIADHGLCYVINLASLPTS